MCHVSSRVRTLRHQTTIDDDDVDNDESSSTSTGRWQPGGMFNISVALRGMPF